MRMPTTKRFILAAIVALTLTSTIIAIDNTSAQTPGGSQPPGAPGGERKPPPEAYKACQNKTAGDSASFTTPRGDAITGVCKELDGTLVLVPDFMLNGQNPPGSGSAGGR